jgi:hypothetical protein
VQLLPVATFYQPRRFEIKMSLQKEHPESYVCLTSIKHTQTRTRHDINPEQNIQPTKSAFRNCIKEKEERTKRKQ